MTVADIYNLLKDGGLIAGLLIILFGGFKKWWVFGWLYSDKTEECKKWEQLAMRGASHAEKAVEVVEKVTITK